MGWKLSRHGDSLSACLCVGTFRPELSRDKRFSAAELGRGVSLLSVAVGRPATATMFDMLASKIGEAQAFADGLASNLDVINMDR